MAGDAAVEPHGRDWLEPMVRRVLDLDDAILGRHAVIIDLHDLAFGRVFLHWHHVWESYGAGHGTFGGFRGAGFGLCGGVVHDDFTAFRLDDQRRL